MVLSLAVSREEVLEVKKLSSGQEASNNGNTGGRNLHLARIGRKFSHKPMLCDLSYNFCIFKVTFSILVCFHVRFDASLLSCFSKYIDLSYVTLHEQKHSS